MPRPMKLRQVAQAPYATFFKPVGVPLNALEGVTLSLEEVEAIRLKDIEDLHQEECAKHMGISRGTIQRLLSRGREKVVNALLSSEAILIGEEQDQ